MFLNYPRSIAVKKKFQEALLLAYKTSNWGEERWNWKQSQEISYVDHAAFWATDQNEDATWEQMIAFVEKNRENGFAISPNIGILMENIRAELRRREKNPKSDSLLEAVNALEDCIELLSVSRAAGMALG